MKAHTIGSRTGSRQPQRFIILSSCRRGGPRDHDAIMVEAESKDLPLLFVLYQGMTGVPTQWVGRVPKKPPTISWL